MGGSYSTSYNLFFWVAPDTSLVLPPMNVNPDTITVTGYSGGAYYASNLAIIHSATFAGGGFRSGGPWMGNQCSNARNATKSCDEDWIEKRVDDLTKLARQEKIDPISNLKDKPFKIISGEDDEREPPALQQIQQSLFESLNATVDYQVNADRTHQTDWTDARDIYSFIWPENSKSGYSSADIISTGTYADIDYMSNGQYLMFDQRMYTTPREFSRANLDLAGYVYIPNNCADGTSRGCKLNVLFSGCFETNYKTWWQLITGDGHEKIDPMIDIQYGYGQMAYLNDQILLIPGKRDRCWDMGAKDSSLMQFTNDPNYLNNKGKQNQAIMNMVSRLMEDYNSTYDLSNMPNAYDIQSNLEEVYVKESPFSFWDRLGLAHSQTWRAIFAQYWLP